MAVISKTQLKNDFLDGKVITEPNMSDLIDSCYNEVSIQKATAELSTAEIADLALPTAGGTPIEIIPAPGSGKINILQNAFLEVTLGSGGIPFGPGFGAAHVFFYQEITPPGGFIVQFANALVSTIDRILPGTLEGSTGVAQNSYVANAPTWVSSLAAPFPTLACTMTMKFTVFYSTVEL